MSPGGPARGSLGEVFVLNRARAPVRWVIVGRDPRGLLLCAPADDLPLLGSADVWISQDLPMGPAAVRCARIGRMDGRGLDGTTLLGVLDEESLAAVHLRMHGARFSSSEADDPERIAWQRTLIDAVAELEAHAGERVGATARHGRRWLVVAAAAGLAAGLLFGVGLRREAVTPLGAGTQRLAAPVMTLRARTSEGERPVPAAGLPEGADLVIRVAGANVYALDGGQVLLLPPEGNTFVWRAPAGGPGARVVALPVEVDPVILWDPDWEVTLREAKTGYDTWRVHAP